MGVTYMYIHIMYMNLVALHMKILAHTHKLMNIFHIPFRLML